MEQPSFDQGTLTEIRIPQIICQLSRSKETGGLHVQQQHQERTLYFDEGKIVFAASNDPDQRLGALLLRRNKVTYRNLQECAPKVVPGKRLGTVLVLDGIIQPNDLYQGVIDQIKEIIYSVFDWETGKFQFHPGPLSQNEVITLNLSTPDLIMTGMQRIWRWSWIKKGLPELNTVYRKSEGWSPVVRKMAMSREAESILDLFDRPRTLEEVLQISEIGDFETCRSIWSFLILGIIEEILVAPLWAGEQAEQESPAPARGNSVAADLEIPAPPVTTATPDPEVEEPTLQIQISNEVAATGETADAGTAAQDLESLLAEPLPFSEISFSDLAELTDLAEASETGTVQDDTPRLQPWETKVQSTLEGFNELHRYIYEMVNLELGSGTNTFISKVFRRASVKFPLVFDGVTIDDFGELNGSVLLANIQGNLVQDYQQALDFLISEERSMINLFLEPKRVDAIETGIQRIHDRRNRALA